MESTDLVGSECTNNRVKDTSVVEENKVLLVPIVRIDQLWGNGRALHLVDNVTNFLEVLEVSSVGIQGTLAVSSGGQRVNDELPRTTRVDLEVQVASYGVLPADREDFDLLFLPRRQLLQWQLQSLGFDSQTSRHGVCGSHPDVRVRCVLDFAPDSKALQFLGEDVEHGRTRNEGGGSEWDFELIACSVVVSKSLSFATGNGEGVEGGYFWWGEIVKGGVDVPTVESSVTEVVFRWNDGLVEGTVVRVLELGLSQAFVVVDGAVADELDLRLTRNGFQVGVQDGPLGLAGLVVSVTVALARGVEGLCQRVLLLWSEVDVAEKQSIVLVESLLNLLELLWSEVPGVDVLHLTTKVGKLGSVSGRREGKWNEFDGH